MGQTILDEYLANIEEDDDNNLPDPKPFGFSSIATMLSEAVEVMEQQAESNRELRRKLDKAEQLAATRNEDIGRLQGELKQATARIAELESQLQQAQVSEADYMILRSANADLKEQLQTAQQWQPVSDEALCFDTADGITASASGKWLRCEDFADKTHVDILLPDNIRLCRKIQPAA